MKVRTALAAVGIAAGIFAAGFHAGYEGSPTPLPRPATVQVPECGEDGTPDPRTNYYTCLDHDSKGLPFVTDGQGHRLYVQTPDGRSG